MERADAPRGTGDVDWSKFDFTRWNLEGLSFGGVDSTVTALLQKVISAPQWPQAFGANLAAMKTAVVQHLTVQSRALQDRSAALDQELAARTSRTQAQIAAMQEYIRAAASPVPLTADPNAYQLAVKAIDQHAQLGLPWLTVQLTDPQSPGSILASAITDPDGNAILALSKDQAEELEKRNVKITLTIVNQAGNFLYTVNNAVCVAANRVETHVATLPSSADTAPFLEVANKLNAESVAQLSSLTAKVDQLKTTYAARKQDIQDQLAQIQATINAIQEELKPPAKLAGS